MPLQNRVQPTGDILAHRARGHFMGNRGILHDDAQTLTHRRWRHKAWVCCVLQFKNRRRRVMQPHHYTELFFHDEAVALAAGHRPCAECRRADFSNFFAAAEHSGPAQDFDTELHAARAIPRQFEQRRHTAEITSLPEGSFLLTDSGPALLWQDALWPFTPDGYTTPERKPEGTCQVLTPQPTLRALRGGYAPQVALPQR